MFIRAMGERALINTIALQCKKVPEFDAEGDFKRLMENLGLCPGYLSPGCCATRPVSMW